MVCHLWIHALLKWHCKVIWLCCFVNNLYLLALTQLLPRHSMFTFPLIRAQMNSSSDTLPVQGNICTVHALCNRSLSESPVCHVLVYKLFMKQQSQNYHSISAQWYTYTDTITTTPLVVSQVVCMYGGEWLTSKMWGVYRTICYQLHQLTRFQNLPRVKF